MFFAEAQIRVHLYGQPTDMRKYAPTMTMQFWMSDGMPRGQ